MTTTTQTMCITMADLMAAITRSHLEEFTELPAEDIASILTHSIMTSVFSGSYDQEMTAIIAYDTLRPFFSATLGQTSPLPIVRLTTDYPLRELIALMNQINTLYVITDYKVIMNLIICEVAPRNG